MKNKELEHVEPSILLDMNELSPIGYNMFVNNEIAVTVDNGKKLMINSKNFQIIDIREIKSTFRKIWNEWFPFGEKNTTLAVGILWTAFVTYIFPILLDAGKVYCAFMIAQGFYKDQRGIESKGGRSGFQNFVYYGKWLILMHLIPAGVSLIDTIGTQMTHDIQTGKLISQ